MRTFGEPDMDLPNNYYAVALGAKKAITGMYACILEFTMAHAITYIILATYNPVAINITLGRNDHHM